MLLRSYGHICQQLVCSYSNRDAALAITYVKYAMIGAETEEGKVQQAWGNFAMHSNVMSICLSFLVTALLVHDLLGWLDCEAFTGCRCTA